MIAKKVIALITILFVMVGCNNQPNALDETPEVEMTKINNPTSIDQDVSNQVKTRLGQDEHITKVHAVNTDKQLAIAIEIKHMKRFGLKEMKKKLTKKVEKAFPKMDVNLSTDKKIILELEQLENDLETKSLTKKEVDQKISKIIKLMNEET